MELNLKHETIRLNETAYDGTLEQSIEHEYQLPDYYPGIFKLLKCVIEPHIYSSRTSGDQLVVDGVALAKLLYADEDGGEVHSLVQKLPFSKTVELKGSIENPSVECHCATDYANCRIISSRKIDIRGAITIWVKVETQGDEIVLGDAQGAGIQLNKQAVSVSSDKIWVNRQFTISDQLEVKDPIEEILELNISSVVDDCKLIANKAITKGTGYISLLYRTTESKILAHNTSIPISQIVDMPSVDEDYICGVDFEVTSIDSTIAQEGSIVNLNADLSVNCNASITKEISTAVDAYSTNFDIKTTTKEITSKAISKIINEKISTQQSFEVDDLQQVNYVKGNITELSATVKNDGIDFTSKLNLTVLGIDNEDASKVIDKTVPMEFHVDADISSNQSVVSSVAKITELEFSLSNNELQLESKLYIRSEVSSVRTFKTIVDLVLDENKPHEKSNAAMTLYYPESGDSIFNIAKQFLTSPSAIKDANDIEGEDITGSKMIMIPIM